MQHSATDFDVAIIGGSLAGTAAAIRLGQSQLTTVLLDRCLFPRRKACGEGLSPRGAELVRELCGSRALEFSAPLAGYSIWAEGREHPFRFEGAGGAGFGCQRFELDELLRSNIGPRVSKVTRRVRGISEAGGLVRIHTDDGDLRARFAIIATGISSRLPTALGFEEAKTAHARYGASVFVRARATVDHVIIVARPGFELFFTPLGSDNFNFAILGHKEHVSRMKNRQGVADLLDIFAKEIGIQPEPFDAPLFSGPFGRRMQTTAIRRSFLVGDSAEVLDPVGGMGMTHALATGMLAGDLIAKFHSGETSSLAARYELGRESVAKPLRAITDLVQTIVTSPHRSKILPMANLFGISRRATSVAHGDPNKRSTQLGSSAITVANAVLAKLVGA